ncbi:hypothetical protein [Spirosoma montaniterrae]|uniref:Big-1 domain-containing protein n=1 Tax=Spirosoma montaniterrae TaxID=1178516 RepID=A0A1P9WTL7_9BACT|nr:hypothetical protein [Spirosoma montaniterrae]AQG78690.1 hypothetical protein AWR27_04675 [Spirosoma montaniterrae]
MNRYIPHVITLLALTLLAGCTKEDDPFVDRVAAPVLVVIDNATGDGGGLTGEPVVSQKVGGPVTMAVRVYELDKTGILDNKVGIDSIPVSALALRLTTRAGAALGDLQTDATGKATITKTWAELGVTAPRAGSSVLLTWTGTHKGQAFSRLSRVQGIN